MSKKKQGKKGAMAKSPSSAQKAVASKAKTQEKLVRLSPGIYRNAKGERVNSRGQPIDARGRVVRKQPPPPAAKEPPPAPGQEQPGQQQSGDFRTMTPEQQQKQLSTDIGSGLQQQMQFLAQQGQFQPGDFGQQMTQAYDTVMQNFERANAPEFARQQADFRQMAAERGLDPNSEAYKSLSQQLNQQQQDARQQAMLTAQQAASNVQQQAFNQAETQYKMPGTMMGAFAPLFGTAGEQQQFGQTLGWEQNKFAQQYQQDLEKLRKQYEYQNKLQASAPRGDPNALTYEQRRNLIFDEAAARAGFQTPEQQPPKTNMGNAFVSGAASGGATQLTS